MKCPNCSQELVKKNYHGIEADNCPMCGGTWFDLAEIDQLEDVEFSDDENKNTMVTSEHTSDRKCPKCDKKMSRFNYRWEELQLETCADHGFWLDKGEEEKVTELIKKFKQDFEKNEKSQDGWEKQMARLRSPGFWSKLKNLF